MAKFTAKQLQLALQVLRTLTPFIMVGIKMSRTKLQRRRTQQLHKPHPKELDQIMIFDIYEQQDLFKIARCGRQSTLVAWLSTNQIPYLHNSKNEVIAHKIAVAASLGVQVTDLPLAEAEPEMYLGD